MSQSETLDSGYQLLVKIGGIAGILILTILALAGISRRSTPPTASCHNRPGEMGLPDQTAFAAQQDITKSKEFLARRWNVSPEGIIVMLVDSEPWMDVFGLLNPASFSSAKIWVINPNNPIGRRWASYLDNQVTPHDGYLYLMAEFSPSTPDEECVAAQFYSTKRTWSRKLQGDFSIIENIAWRDQDEGSGTLFAYQSQDLLPTISVQIDDFVLVEESAFHTPVN